MIENVTSNATAEVAVAGFFVFFIIIWAIFFILGILGTILWIFMLVDAIKRKYKTENDRLVWILILVLTNVMGAIIYYFVVKKKDKKAK
jgi:prolipoprotein diacylglyceryltransferase